MGMVRIVCLAAILCSGHILNAQQLQDKVDVDLASQLQDGASKTFRVYVWVHPSTSTKRAFAEIRSLAKGADKETRQRLVQNIKSVGAAAATSLAGEVLGKFGDEKIRFGADKFWLVSGFTASLTGENITELAKDERVRSIILDVKKPTGIPEVKSVDLPAAASLEQWNIEKVGASKAWARGFTGKGVTIAIIDTGVDVNHADFGGRIYTNPVEIAGNGKDDDGNGHVDDMQGWDFVEADNDPADKNGHGTHCAGSAAGGNGFGVAKDATMLPVRVLDEAGNGFETDAVLGVQYALGQGADVISLSAGWHNSPHRALWEQVIQDLNQLGVVVCVAAGNEDGIRPIRSPGEQQKALTVGAVDSSFVLATFSSKGPAEFKIESRIFKNDKPDLSAPGVDIRSFRPANKYGLSSGTSMATPHVAGAVAVLKQAKPNATPDEIKAALIKTCLAPTKANETGAGVISIDEALKHISGQ